MNSSDSTTEGSENSSSEQSEKMVHSHAKTLNPSPHTSDSESEDDSDSSTPPLKKHHQQEQKKEQQPQKQKDQLTPPSPSPSALISNKTAATKTSMKRPREVESVATPELPPTKKKATARTVQHSDKVPAKETKKAHRQKVAESVSTPSSPQKSGKKGLHVWNIKDELAFLNGLLAFTKGNNEFPKNMSAVYDYVRNTMDIHYSNKQFRDKFRRLKTKFQALVENMEVNSYSFKSPDEAALYKISKQLWGVEDEGDDEHTHNAETVSKASMDGKEKKKKKPPVQAEEEEGEKIKDGDQGEEEEGEDEPKRDKTMTNTLVNNNAGDVDRIREERDDMVKEMKNSVANILNESEAKKKAMLEGHLLNTRADHVQYPYIDSMTGIYSGRQAPVLNKVKAEALEEKWRKQQIVEMKAYLGRLDLLQEECEMYLEGLREPVGRDRS